MNIRGNLFRTPKHKKFQYTPRYYDEQKEELKERVRRAEKRAEDTEDARKERIKTGMRRSVNTSGMDLGKVRRKAVFKANMMVLIFALLITLGLALIFLYI